MLIKKWSENKPIQYWFVNIWLNRLSRLQPLYHICLDLKIRSIFKALLNSQNNGVKPNSSGVAFVCMSCKTDAEMLAKHLPVMLMKRVLLVRSEGGVGCVWRGRRWWLKCGHSSPVCDGAQIGAPPLLPDLPLSITVAGRGEWDVGSEREGTHTHPPTGTQGPDGAGSP